MIGVVAELTRYPVKSMAGEPMSAVTVDWLGIAGDRQYGFFKRNDRSRFPWLTARDIPDLVAHRARFRDPALPKRSPVDVRLPDGRSLALNARELIECLQSRVGEELGLLQLGRGAFDAMPISLSGSASHAALDAACGRAVDGRRFRFNIMIESDVPEAEWCGRKILFGDGSDSAELFVTDSIERCAMITIDPDSARRDPELMRVVAQQFGNSLGVYATTARPGQIRVGDRVVLL